MNINTNKVISGKTFTINNSYIIKNDGKKEANPYRISTISHFYTPQNNTPALALLTNKINELAKNPIIGDKTPVGIIRDWNCLELGLNLRSYLNKYEYNEHINHRRTFVGGHNKVYIIGEYNDACTIIHNITIRQGLNPFYMIAKKNVSSVNDTDDLEGTPLLEPGTKVRTIDTNTRKYNNGIIITKNTDGTYNIKNDKNEIYENIQVENIRSQIITPPKCPDDDVYELFPYHSFKRNKSGIEKILFKYNDMITELDDVLHTKYIWLQANQYKICPEILFIGYIIENSPQNSEIPFHVNNVQNDYLFPIIISKKYDFDLYHYYRIGPGQELILNVNKDNIDGKIANVEENIKNTEISLQIVDCLSIMIKTMRLVCFDIKPDNTVINDRKNYIDVRLIDWDADFCYDKNIKKRLSTNKRAYNIDVSYDTQLMLDITILYMATLFYYSIGCNIFYKYIITRITNSYQDLRAFWLALGNDNQFVDNAINYFTKHENADADDTRRSKIFNEETTSAELFDVIYNIATTKIYNDEFMLLEKARYNRLNANGGKKPKKSRKLRRPKKSRKLRKPKKSRKNKNI